MTAGGGHGGHHYWGRGSPFHPTYAEYRVSIYGSAADQWGKLAEWVVDNELHSPNNRWMVQIPRIYNVFRSKVPPSFLSPRIP